MRTRKHIDIVSFERRPRSFCRWHSRAAGEGARKSFRAEGTHRHRATPVEIFECRPCRRDYRIRHRQRFSTVGASTCRPSRSTECLAVRIQPNPSIANRRAMRPRPSMGMNARRCAAGNARSICCHRRQSSGGPMATGGGWPRDRRPSTDNADGTQRWNRVTGTRGISLQFFSSRQRPAIRSAVRTGMKDHRIEFGPSYDATSSRPAAHPAFQEAASTIRNS